MSIKEQAQSSDETNSNHCYSVCVSGSYLELVFLRLKISNSDYSKAPSIDQNILSMLLLFLMTPSSERSECHTIGRFRILRRRSFKIPF
jgi:hypothetical protein